MRAEVVVVPEAKKDAPPPVSAEVCVCDRERARDRERELGGAWQRPARSCHEA